MPFFLVIVIVIVNYPTLAYSQSCMKLHNYEVKHNVIAYVNSQH